MLEHVRKGACACKRKHVHARESAHQKLFMEEQDGTGKRILRREMA